MMIDADSRAIAKRCGLLRYFTGKACKNGHISYRQTSDGKCSGCKSDYRKMQRATNGDSVREKERLRTARDKDAIYARNKAWRDANHEQVSISKRKHRAENIEHITAYYKAWCIENPGIRSALEQKRRGRKFSATPSWYGELDDLAAVEAYDLCRLRRSATGLSWQIDHMIPLQSRFACGLHLGSNLQVIPAFMNNSKNNKMIFIKPGEWILSA